MRKASFILLTFLLILSARGECADCVMILVCDTIADNINDSVYKDLQNMQAEGRRISEYTGMPLVEVIFTGDDLRGEELLAVLRGLQLQSDDFVFFFFSGHGYRTPSKGKDPWPNFYFTLEDQGLDFGLVIEILRGKNPRLLLALADCCNTEFDDDIAPLLVKAPKLREIRKNYQRLFLDAKGEILIASSKIGEASWAIPSGSVYSLAFLEGLRKETHYAKKAAWSPLLKSVKKSVKKYQTPYHQIIKYQTSGSIPS